jgi:ABC-type multidrug transport system permease subunit
MPPTTNDETNIMIEETPQELEHRTKTLVDESNQVFNRFLSEFDSLIKKIIAIFQIFLVLISIQSTVILALIQRGKIFSCLEILLLILIIVLAIFSGIILLYLIYPKNVKDAKIFEDERFSDLLSLPSQELLSDYLLQMKKSYDHNVQIYKIMVWWFYKIYYSITGMVVFFVIFIGVIITQNLN